MMGAVMKRVIAVLIGLCLLPVSASAQVIEYYHLDAVGNVRAVTDQQGRVIERHDYLPFGEECLTGPCASNPGVGAGQPRKFTGKERDQETGLDYFGARYYGSKIGRFTTVDPYLDQSAALLDPQQWNRYSYAHNNPVKFVDPDGRHPIIIGLALAAAFVLNNPTNTNVTQGPTHDTIVPNSVIVAGGYGLAAGGTRMAAKEVLQEAVENVTGVPTSVSIGRFLKGGDVADVAANARRGIQEGCCVTGVVDRSGAAARRAERLKGVDPRKGYDRDEFPPAVVKPDNPSGYRVDHVNPSQNRRSGSRLGNELKGVPDGTRVRIDPPKE